ASQGTFITNSCVKRLGLRTQSTAVPVFGMAQTALDVAKEVVKCWFQPIDGVELQVEALVVDNITNCPSISVRPRNWDHLQGLKLADPTYFRSEPVDILLGAEWFASVMLGNTVAGPNGAPSAVESIWGYCLIGRIIRQTLYEKQSEPGFHTNPRIFGEGSDSLSKPSASADTAQCSGGTVSNTSLRLLIHFLSSKFPRPSNSERSCRNFNASTTEGTEVTISSM
ncbi:hypothetical protein CBL_21056, partial [Carabus blaptoides fortunei]